MTSPLIPALNGRTLTLDVALRQPSIIRDRIARLADDQILLPKFFRQFGAKVEGGGLLYSVIAASDFYTTDVESARPVASTGSWRASTLNPSSPTSRIGAAGSRSPTNN
jgi:hypothetical protein